MPMSLRAPLLLAALAAVAFFFNLGGAHLWDVDEAIFSQAAKEMFQRGDYVVPYFNGAVFPDKPAMMYWLMIAAYELFGTTEFAARFWSAVFGVGSVLLTYRLGQLMFSPAAGFWGGLSLASCIQFGVIARAATPDAFLVFFSTLAIVFFVSGTATARIASGEPNERNAPWAGQTTFEPSWLTWALAYAAMGCGALTKGPIGVVLPTATIGLFLLVVRARPVDATSTAGWRGAARHAVRWMASVFAPGHFVATVWSMRPLTAIAVVLGVAGPWYALVGARTDGAWLAGFFGVHNFGRFVSAMENHRGPIIYYLVAIAVGFFPWSVLFAPGWMQMRRQLAQHHPWRPGYVLVGSWLAVWIGFFSIAGTKLPSYVAPAYPALGLFTGCFVANWLRDPSALTKYWRRMAWGTVAATGVGMLVALPIVAQVFLHGDAVLAAIGVIPLLAATAGLVLCERGRVRASAWTMSVLGLTLVVTILGFGAARVDQHQVSAPLAAKIAAATPPGATPAIGSFHFFRPSFVFYTAQPIEQFRGPEEVTAFFAAHPHDAFLITTDERIDRLDGALPADVAVLDKRPRFLQPGNVILLGRAHGGAATASSADAAAQAR
jgi:4-amino-4-deoxy-L-arabinose transferase-like glycosyltransferase